MCVSLRFPWGAPLVSQVPGSHGRHRVAALEMAHMTRDLWGSTWATWPASMLSSRLRCICWRTARWFRLKPGDNFLILGPSRTWTPQLRRGLVCARDGLDDVVWPTGPCTSFVKCFAAVLVKVMRPINSRPGPPRSLRLLPREDFDTSTSASRVFASRSTFSRLFILPGKVLSAGALVIFFALENILCSRSLRVSPL